MTVMKIRLADLIVCVLCLFGCCDRVDSVIFTVAQDGSANFSKIVDALATAPTFSQYVTTIIITRGTHHEYIRVDSNKANILFVGDGIGRTIIAGNCSFEGGGYNIDRSATVGVEGDGFVAKYISFVNNAGIEMGEALAFQSSANRTTIYERL